MFRINHELMFRKRLELGWTPEELAEEADLDERTIRRIEAGGSRARHRSAVQIARALKLDLVTLVLEDPAGRIEPESDGNGNASASSFVDGTTQGKRVILDDWSLKESLYVLSSLLARSFISDGEAMEANDLQVDRVVAAFKAADGVIKTTLSGGGEWGEEEARCVLSLLLARYGAAFNRGSADGVEAGDHFVQAACEQARRELPHHMTAK